MFNVRDLFVVGRWFKSNAIIFQNSGDSTVGDPFCGPDQQHPTVGCNSRLIVGTTFNGYDKVYGNGCAAADYDADGARRPRNT